MKNTITFDQALDIIRDYHATVHMQSAVSYPRGQHFTSACTSINKTKLPAIFSKQIHMLDGLTIVDYGCGKYTDHIRASLPQGTTYLPFDPYNQPEEVNAGTLLAIDYERADLLLCSNVMNVIDDDATLYDIAWKMLHMVKTWHDVCVTVYEGDRSGVGRQTGPDQYQRNERLASYAKYFERWGARTEILNGVLYAHMATKKEP